MAETAKRPLYVPHAGPSLLEMPLLSKGSVFSTQERIDFNLQGLLPHNIKTIEEQIEHAYSQYNLCNTDLDRHILLRSVQDNNETLFFRLLEEHLEEIVPIIYTPTVGQACQEFSKIYRTHHGLFIPYPGRERINDILRSATKNNAKIVVVTDSERILSLGGQGIGGMDIPIGKLSLYTTCGGISPTYTLPVVLDVGTNNPGLLNDPMYMGWRHERVSGAQYEELVDLLIQAIKCHWPNVLLQFEDFTQTNVMPLLERYKDKLCCFNDDIQGTAAVAVGTLLIACKAKGEKFSEQTVTFVGAGSAGCGIAEQIVAAMRLEGLDEAQTCRCIFMAGRWGLLTGDMGNLFDFQRRLAQKCAGLGVWGGQQGDDLALLEVVRNAWPTVLTGVPGQRGLFPEEVIRELYSHCKQPPVMPLPNPTPRVEAIPQGILNWTDGQMLAATGSPFRPVQVGDKWTPIVQCNNAYIFPGIGLGVTAARANRVTEGMLMAAANALANCSLIVARGGGVVLPAPGDIREVSKRTAVAVVEQVQAEGKVLYTSDEVLNDVIGANFWFPRYRAYCRTSL